MKRAAGRLGISLRRRGYRGGLILGQPRGVSLRADMRADLLRPGTADVVAQRLAMDHEAELCPRCAMRPQRVESTGLCRQCHLVELADRWAEVNSEREGQRRLWMMRQAAHRSLLVEKEETAGAGYGEPVVVVEKYD